MVINERRTVNARTVDDGRTVSDGRTVIHEMREADGGQ